MPDLRPKQILKDIGQQYPQAWQQFKMFRGGKGKNLPNWPDWCYVPMAAGYAIVTGGGAPNEGLFDPKLSPAVITAAAAWRVSQGVYRFDADLYNALINQPMDDKLPCEALKLLPEWCVYIETIGAVCFDKPIVGFWAHLESDANDGRMELRLVLMHDDGVNAPMAIHLGDWTLEEGLERMRQEAMRHAPPGVYLPVVDYIGDIAPLVQLVLYLCAENIDMPRIPAHPNARVRMSGQVDVPREPTFWSVGERIGAAIRKHRNQEGLSELEKTPGLSVTRSSPIAHLRRAHWHHFWTGPMQGDRKLILRWLPPIPVGVDEDEGPAVIHKVK